MNIILFFAILLILVFIWMCSAVFLEISYKKNELAKESEIYVKYLFFKKRIGTKKKKKNQDEKKSADFEFYKKKTENILYIFSFIKKDVLKILNYCTKHLIVIKYLNFDFEYGLDDPMYTGILNGIFYGVAYNIMSVVYHNMTVDKFAINIKPDFERVCHSMKADCILRLKNVHIIVIMVKIVKLYFKLKMRMKTERK